MFIHGRNHLKAVCVLVGIPAQNISLRPQKQTGGRSASIFTIPNRGSVNFDIDNQQEDAYRPYDDPVDSYTSPPSLIGPKQKRRIKKANQTITFMCLLTNTTPELLNTDFRNFFRNLGKRIYDGQTANYINENGVTIADIKGNEIKIIPGQYDFDDSAGYTSRLSRVFIQIQFTGGIFIVPDATTGVRDILNTKVNIDTTLTV